MGKNWFRVGERVKINSTIGIIIDVFYGWYVIDWIEGTNKNFYSESQPINVIHHHNPKPKGKVRPLKRITNVSTKSKAWG